MILLTPHSEGTSSPENFLQTTVRASAGYADDFCAGPNPTNFLRSNNRVWIAALLPAIVFIFLGLALITDDCFVPALEVISARLNLSEDVAGATFMAAGSSAPELFISLLSTFVGGDDLGVGTIVGSAVFNICVIIGISGLCAKRALDLDPRPLLRDATFYTGSVLLLLVFVLFSTRGKATWWEGLILVIAYGGYIAFMAFANKPYLRATKRWVPMKVIQVVDKLDKMEIGDDTPTETETETDDTSKSPTESDSSPLEEDSLEALDTIGEIESEETGPTFLGISLPMTPLEWVTFPLFFPWRLAFRFTVPSCSGEEREKWWPLTFTMSIVWVMILTYVMTEAAKLAGCYIGIPSSVMGLTVLAAGTSVPDALASIAVVREGRGDMAVSNAIGSNVFDILLGLGLPWFIGALVKRSAINVTVTPVGFVVIPIAILLAITFMLLIILPLFRWKLGKPLGVFMFVIYGAFVTYSLLDVYIFKIGGAA